MSNGRQLHCFRFPWKRNACPNIVIVRWFRTRNAEAAENCFLMSPSFSIKPRSTGEKIFQIRRISTSRCNTAAHFCDYSPLISSSNFFEHCIFSFTVVSEQTFIKKCTGCKHLFIPLFIYSASVNSICKSAKCAFLYLEVYVDMTLRAILFFCGLNKFWAPCNHEIFERTFYTSFWMKRVIVICAISHVAQSYSKI